MRLSWQGSKMSSYIQSPLKSGRHWASQRKSSRRPPTGTSLQNDNIIIINMSNNKRLIVCLTGMPGAGKSSVASFLKEKGFEVVTMGDVVREEAKRQGLEPTDTNLGKMMLKLRQDLGSGAIGYIVLQKLARDGSHSNVVIDGR